MGGAWRIVTGTSSGAFWNSGPMNAQMLASPNTVSATPKTRQIQPKRRRAFAPGVMPHFAAKSQMPYAKCQHTAIMAIT